MARALTVVALLAALALSAAAPASAGSHCYRADANSGELLFDGVLEGTPFTGRFRAFSVVLCLENEDLTSARIRVTVDPGAADTGNRQGNEAMRGEEFFHVARFPEAVWTSRDLHPVGDGYLAEGELTVRDISAPQSVHLRYQPGDPARLSGHAEIMRLDWRVGTGEFEDPEFIRNRVDVRFELTLGKSVGH
ncbi:YceI family protein [Thioalkalivibrio thiocyanodenitrificans]|uniref:YceI family protein n=1 Tax=Thioalkalivibrio thiocyanodenitrificans TaxID=243063 RepID=UPI000361C7A5|nr:YceI family protein [Thioalkalivibrio thiocyanodenitrificans]